MSNEKQKDYYVKKKKSLMKQYDIAVNIGKNVLIKRFGENKFKELITRAREEFESLIPELPFIGGKKNRNTDNLINGSMMLALIHNFEKEGLEFREIATLCNDLYEAFYKFLPSEDIFQEDYINQIKEDAKKSQLKQYPEDWVFEFIEGDGETFDYGVNYLECGVYKFFKKQNSENLMPLICVSDDINAKCSGYGLNRPESIGNGDPMCIFRYIKGGAKYF